MNNPPAFPLESHWLGELSHLNGMTLRDYFAAKTMQALLSDLDWRQDMNFVDTALAAYRQADSMLKVREQ